MIPAGTGMKRYRNIKLDSDIDEEEYLFDDFDEYEELQEESFREEMILEE